jgi:uncharacterized surface protein with fasciclin (FAS1) repeats
MIRTVRSLVAVAATLFAVAACADSPTTSTEIQPSEELTLSSETAELRRGTQTIVEIAAGDTAFTTLVAAVVAADLVEALSGTPPSPSSASMRRTSARSPRTRSRTSCSIT